MVVIRSVDPVEAVPLFLCMPEETLLPPEWPLYCKERGLLALVAEVDGELVGFAVAESHRQVVHILSLEGDGSACRLLLERLVRLAGERDVSGWFAAERTDILDSVEQRGFAHRGRADLDGRLMYFYAWEQNEA